MEISAYDIEQARVKREKAFRVIQNDKKLYKMWCDAKTEYERELIMSAVLWELAYDDGYESGYINKSYEVE